MEKDYYANQVTIDKLQRLYSDSEERADTASVQVIFSIFVSLGVLFLCFPFSSQCDVRTVDFRSNEYRI